LDRLASDEQLMVAVRHGDLGAFETLVVRHQATAWNTAYRFLGDASEAEDLAQEAFLKIFNAAARYEPTAKFRTYLCRVVSRLCLDHVQKKKPRYGPDLPEVADGRPSATDLMTLRERERDVRQALDCLPGNQRLVVLLRYFEGLSYADIAGALETTPKAVERLLARARAALERRLTHLIQ